MQALPSPDVRDREGLVERELVKRKVAIAEREDGISVAWQDKVSDEDYRAALANYEHQGNQQIQQKIDQLLADDLALLRRYEPG